MWTFTFCEIDMSRPIHRTRVRKISHECLNWALTWSDEVHRFHCWQRFSLFMDVLNNYRHKQNNILLQNVSRFHSSKYSHKHCSTVIKMSTPSKWLFNDWLTFFYFVVHFTILSVTHTTQNTMLQWIIK